MNYIGNIYRPPSEANSILIQATIGCSHNKCSFCEMYIDKSFSIKDEKQVLEDIEEAGRLYPRTRRLFICDGDALILPQKKLVTILKMIKEKIPRVRRVGLYANCRSIELKSEEELKELFENGLGIIYLGIETGYDKTLLDIDKNATFKRLAIAGKKVKNSGIKLSVTVLLGIAGKENSIIHAKETGKLLTKIDPDFVGALTLMLTPGTQLFQDHQKKQFELIEAKDILLELKTMISETTLTNGYFHANHASNYLSISAHFPEDKEKTIVLINEALKGNIGLKSEYMRGL